MDTHDELIQAEQLDAALRHLVPEMVDAGAVVRDGCTVMLEMQTAEGVVGVDITSRARQAMTAVRHRRSVERRRMRGHRPTLMRRPRARGAGRPRAAPARRAAAVGSRDGPDDDGPAEPAPALALAPPPKAILHYAVSRCPECGRSLLWVGARLAYPNRSCPRWGRSV